VRHQEWSAAVDAAKKANSIRTWKEVNLACVEAKQFRLAQVAGLHVLAAPDELDSLLDVYESRGYFEEAIALLETGKNDEETTHRSMLTELAGLYSKYKEAKLYDFIVAYADRIQIPRVINYAQMNAQWRELAFLYQTYDEIDHAAMCIMDHSADAWTHPLFKDVLTKVKNTDICYRGVSFYLEEHPLLVNDLLASLVNIVDHSRVVALGQRLNQIPLIRCYL